MYDAGRLKYPPFKWIEEDEQDTLTDDQPIRDWDGKDQLTPLRGTGSDPDSYKGGHDPDHDRKYQPLTKIPR